MQPVVQLDEPVSIADFAKYISTIYSETINNPEVVYGDISGLFRDRLSKDEADFAIGDKIGRPDLIVMGSKTPTDRHEILQYRATDENFGKFIKRLEEICDT